MIKETSTVKKLFSNSSKKVRVINYIIVFILCLLFRLFSFLRHVDLQIRTDDFGPLLYPALIAGRDWSTLYTKVPYYYGYGYYWIFAPVFKLVTNPYSIIMVVSLINTLIVSLMGLLIYHILVKYFNMKDKWYTVLSTVMATLFEGNIVSTLDENYHTDNEIPIFICIWFVVLIICRILNAKTSSEKIRSSIGLGLILGWGLTVHERMNSLVLAVACGFALLIIAQTIGSDDKKSLLLEKTKYFLISLMSFLVVYVIHRIIKARIVNYFWGSRDDLHNTDAMNMDSFYFWENIKGIKAVCCMIVGNLHSINVTTYGLGILALILAGLLVIKLIFGRKDSLTHAELVMLIFGICTGIMILGIAYKWGCMFYEGLTNNQIVYGYKGLCYSRYYYSFLGPLCLGVIAVLADLYDKKSGFFKFDIKIKAVFLLITVLIEVAFFLKVYPLIDQQSGLYYLIRAYNLPFGDFDTLEQVLTILKATMVIWAAGVAFIIIGKRCLMIPIIALAVTGVSRVQRCELPGFTLGSYNLAASLNFMDMYENTEGIDKDEQVYIITKSSSIAVSYQFYFWDKKCVRDFPAEDIDKAIIFSDCNLSEVEDYSVYGGTLNEDDPFEDYQMIELSESEYVYIK